MIKQLLLFKFKNDVKQQKIDLFFEKYRKLENLSCLESVEFGYNVSKEGFDKGFQYGAVTIFKNRKAVAEFLKHPKHVELTEKFLNPLLKDFTLVEYETK